MMASNFQLAFALSFIVLAAIHGVMAGDPDILSDFILLEGVSGVDGNFFTYTGLRVLVSSSPPPTFEVLKANIVQFPALNGQSVSYAVLRFPANSVNPPHTHPRASELLFLIDGTLEVGFVDTNNKLFTQTLEIGDIFVFPKGLVHFQYNSDPKNSALAISAFGSASPGLISIPNTLFNTTIDDVILAKSFKTHVATIKKLIAGLH